MAPLSAPHPRDDADTAEAILTGTLSDAESIQELCTRRIAFAAQKCLTPAQRESGLRLFDRAIQSDVPAAIQSRKPAVEVLRATMTAAGKLVWEAKKGDLLAGTGASDRLTHREHTEESTVQRTIKDKKTKSAKVTHKAAFKNISSGPQERDDKVRCAVPKSGVRARAKGKPLKPSLVVKLRVSIPQDYLARPADQGRKFFPDPLRHGAEVPLFEPYAYTDSDADTVRETSLHFNTTLPSTRGNDESAWESASESSPPRSPASLSTTTVHHLLPPYPLLDSRQLCPFCKGVSTALENILEDHLAHPARGLQRLVKDLEDAQPRVDDWERKAVLKGGKWVYQALRGVCERVDEPDVVGACAQVRAHAAREYARVKKRLD